MKLLFLLNSFELAARGVPEQTCKPCLMLLNVPSITDILDIVKLREREGQRVDLGRSLKGHLWMVDGGWWYTFP